LLLLVLLCWLNWQPGLLQCLHYRLLWQRLSLQRLQLLLRKQLLHALHKLLSQV
jgi:hypothetical protein